jgi:hypothetical protein
VKELNRHRAFADGGRNAPRRPVAYVAPYEDAGIARFERVRVALERPLRPVVVHEEIAARHQEAMLVPPKPPRDARP